MANLRSLSINGNTSTVPFLDTTLTIAGAAADAKAVGDAISGGGGGAGLESITYAQLKTKRNNGTLTPGGQYRITDYVCTTTQAESRAVSHPFDIIVVADDESTLNESARACLHEGDTYYSAVGNQTNLEAWELKYCIDNDTNRFAWADTTNGKGVVYYMKDDRNNECPYDFKQIQFKRYEITECEAVPSLVGKYTSALYGEAITGVDENNPMWCYTFSVYDSEAETIEMLDGSIKVMDENDGVIIYGNHINEYHNYQDLDNEMVAYVNYLSEIVFINTFGNNCYSNTFGDGCRYINLSAGTISQSKRYYHILDGTEGTSNSPITITGTNGNNYVTYVGKNSNGVLKTWVPADLAT